MVINIAGSSGRYHEDTSAGAISVLSQKCGAVGGVGRGGEGRASVMSICNDWRSEGAMKQKMCKKERSSDVQSLKTISILMSALQCFVFFLKKEKRDIKSALNIQTGTRWVSLFFFFFEVTEPLFHSCAPILHPCLSPWDAPSKLTVGLGDLHVYTEEACSTYLKIIL